MQSETPDDSRSWSRLRRLGFRFVFLLLGILNIPFVLTFVPSAWEPYQTFTDAIVSRVAGTIFGLAIPEASGGSGDTTGDYVWLFTVAAFAAVTAIVWTILDRSPGNDARLHRWLRLYLRLILATTMLSYGASKVMPSQFPAPGLDRLLQPFGFASPMGLLWTFMGASRIYSFFGGVLEIACGLLLATRRTTLAGALLCAAVSANIVALNFGYDVPVKLLSLRMLAESLILIAPDAWRMFDFFVRNRATPAAEYPPYFRNVYLERTAVIALVVLALLDTVRVMRYAHTASARYTTARGQFHGIWNVEELIDNGVSRPPLVADETRWRRFIFPGTGNPAIQLMTEERLRVGVIDDPKAQTFRLRKKDPKWSAILNYRQPKPDVLLIDGMIDGHHIQARLHQVPTPPFLLQTRGFHWITEDPYNR